MEEIKQKRLKKMALYTTFGVGGEAERLFIARSADDVINGVLSGLIPKGAVILGRGSNVLVSDNGVSGAVVLFRDGEIRTDGGFITADAGASLALLSKKAAAAGLSGLEWAGGIPGTVGGAVKMNAGAFNGEISGALEWVDVLTEGKTVRLSTDECGFGYRSSGFGGDDIILRGGFRLKVSDKSAVENIMAEFKERRARSQPSGKSAGSVFKGADRPAGYYIERAGLKGKTLGGAEVSAVHANFILNRGGATAKDIAALIDLIKSEVYLKFGVLLKEEIKYIGDF